MRGLVGGVLLLAGLVLFLVGVAGLVRRRASLAGVTSRREAGVAVGTALAILVVGGAISPQDSTPSDTLAVEQVRAAAGPCGADPVAFPREGAGTARGPGADRRLTGPERTPRSS